jgi:hypothetical protein
MRASLALVFVLCACGPDLSAWKGTYAGTAVITAGRQPEAYTGTLVVTDGARFEGSAVSNGTTFSCALTAATGDATTATFTVPTSCDLLAAPADDCTRKVTVNAASATLNGATLEGNVTGRVAATCTSSSSTATDFAMQISATRR